MQLRRILRISRPRFWVYEAGTYLVGLAAAHMAGVPWGALANPVVVTFFLYFLFPANLLIYGINDIFDYETDKLNPKKVAYEALVAPAEHRALWLWVLATTLPFVALLAFVPLKASLAIDVFFFCAVFYSALPLRAKTKPGLDSLLSAGHYVATGVFAFLLAGAPTLGPWPIIAGLCWAMAMHAFSAVPDIEADAASGCPTIATKLGARYTVYLCLVLYILAAALGSLYLGYTALLFGVFYAALMVAALTQPSRALFRLYTYFPTVNFLVGMAMWFAIALS